MKRLYGYVLLLFALILGCTAAAKGGAPKTFEITTVRDLSVQEAMQTDLNDLPLADKPLISLSDITDFYWDQQVFLVRKPGIQEELRKIPVMGRPFVVSVQGERIFLGALWSPLSSQFPPDLPLIDTLGITGVPFLKEKGVWKEPSQDEMYLSFSHFNDAVYEETKDRRIHDALKRAGVLRED